jgi:small ligand-binding sensory domain FIST
LQALYPAATIVGGMASGMIAERTACVFLDGHVYTEGGVALGIGGPYTLDAHVSQGCDPIGEPWTITEVDHNALVAISNRPAFDVLQDALLALAPGRRERAQRHLVVGLANNEYLDRYGRGDFLIRGILGIDARRGSIAIGGSPRVGQTIQFHLREAAGAEADLARMLERARENAAPVVAAVLCTCDGRGQALFDMPGHDARVVHAALPGVPLAGAPGRDPWLHRDPRGAPP